MLELNSTNPQVGDCYILVKQLRNDGTQKIYKEIIMDKKHCDVIFKLLFCENGKRKVFFIGEKWTIKCEFEKRAFGFIIYLISVLNLEKKKNLKFLEDIYNTIDSYGDNIYNIEQLLPKIDFDIIDTEDVISTMRYINSYCWYTIPHSMKKNVLEKNMKSKSLEIESTSRSRRRFLRKLYYKISRKEDYCSFNLKFNRYRNYMPKCNNSSIILPLFVKTKNCIDYKGIKLSARKIYFDSEWLNLFINLKEFKIHDNYKYKIHLDINCYEIGNNINFEMTVKFKIKTITVWKENGKLFANTLDIWNKTKKYHDINREMESINTATFLANETYFENVTIHFFTITITKLEKISITNPLWTNNKKKNKKFSFF